MPHRLAVPGVALASGETVEITGREAFHAVSVKRVRVGESVELLDGTGTVGAGVVERAQSDRGRGDPRLLIRVSAVRVEAPGRPALRVFTAAPKGDRLEQMIDQLAQVGAATWGLLETARGVVEPREHKLERVERIGHEAAKQCGRAHFLKIAGPRGVGSFAGPGVVVADASGGPYAAGGLAELDVLVGPEGGFTDEELGTLRGAGARVARFGPHVLRVETAAVVAAAVVLEVEGRGRAE